MQNAQMVGSLGVNSAHVYAVTFTIGAALSGLAGGYDRAAVGRSARNGGAIRCQGLHHRHQRRQRCGRGHPAPHLPCWARSTPA